MRDYFMVWEELNWEILWRRRICNNYRKRKYLEEMRGLFEGDEKFSGRGEKIFVEIEGDCDVVIFRGGVYN